MLKTLRSPTSERKQIQHSSVLTDHRVPSPNSIYTFIHLEHLTTFFGTTAIRNTFFPKLASCMGSQSQTRLSDGTTTTQLGGKGKRSRTVDWEKKELTLLRIVTDRRHVRKDTSTYGLVSFSVKWQDHIIIQGLF